MGITSARYMCPGLSGYVVERVGLRADVQAFDLVGQGCAAALPNPPLDHAFVGDPLPAHLAAAGTCCESASKSVERRCIWITSLASIQALVFRP
ncbi:hypothetical protein [Paraburkholderia fungorum]|uniref:hypothetical protein n=1 Tax=Paraburkholderia fungorum TaxID=134537 RepID=UPI0038574877